MTFCASVALLGGDWQSWQSWQRRQRRIRDRYGRLHIDSVRGEVITLILLNIC